MNCSKMRVAGILSRVSMIGHSIGMKKHLACGTTISATTLSGKRKASMTMRLNCSRMRERMTPSGDKSESLSSIRTATLLSVT